jgi:hypothetical protein
VSLPLTRRDLSVWDIVAQQWKLSRGGYGLMVGSSSRDLRAKRANSDHIVAWVYRSGNYQLMLLRSRHARATTRWIVTKNEASEFSVTEREQAVRDLTSREGRPFAIRKSFRNR